MNNKNGMYRTNYYHCAFFSLDGMQLYHVSVDSFTRCCVINTLAFLYYRESATTTTSLIKLLRKCYNRKKCMKGQNLLSNIECNMNKTILTIFTVSKGKLKYCQSILDYVGCLFKTIIQRFKKKKTYFTV